MREGNARLREASCREWQAEGVHASCYPVPRHHPLRIAVYRILCRCALLSLQCFAGSDFTRRISRVNNQ
jgi:hypothetical protein